MRTLCLTLALGFSILAAPAARAGDDVAALEAWRDARERMELAGEYVGRGNVEKAHEVLSRACRELPTAYGQIAFDRLRELPELPGRLVRGPTPSCRAYADACYRLLSFDAALELYREVYDSGDRSGEKIRLTVTIARCLFELGRPGEALDELADLQYHEPGARGRWDLRREERSIRIISDEEASVREARGEISRWYRDLRSSGPERHLLALGQLVLLVERCSTKEEKRLVLADIRRCLGELGDEAGDRAWERRALRELGGDPEVAATLALERGMRAIRHRQPKKALGELGKVVEVYPGTSARPLAQLHYGVLLREEGRLDESILQLEGLLLEAAGETGEDGDTESARRLHAHRIGVELARSCFYDRQFERALRIAERVRDELPADRGCPTCTRIPGTPLPELIEVLQDFVKG